MTERSESGKIDGQHDDKSSVSDELEDGEAIRQPREVTVIADSIENIDSCKVKKIVVKIEFDGNVLAQSEELDVKKGVNEIGLTAVIATEEVTPEFLDRILANPVLFTVIDRTVPLSAVTESTPKTDKESKKKTSKSSAASKVVVKTPKPVDNVLGICNFDIGHLVMGSKRIKETIALEQEKKLSILESVSVLSLPKISVIASAGEESLISESEYKYNNVVGVTVESVYNAPEYLKEGTIFNASIPLPRFGDKLNNLVFPNGEVCLVRSSNCRKKWLTLLHIEGNGGKSKNLIDPNLGTIIHTLPGCINLENEVKKMNCLIEWNTWRKSLFIKADLNYFFFKIMKYRVWPIEIYLTEDLKPSKPEKKNKTAPGNPPPPPSPPLHFMAFLNLTTLLYPGITKARVVAQLYTYSQTDLINKFGAEMRRPESAGTVETSGPSPTKVSIKASAKASAKTSAKASAKPSEKTSGKASEKTSAKISEKTSKSTIKETEDKNDAPGVPVFNEEGRPVFIIVEVELFQPFTPKKDPEYLFQKLQNYTSLKKKPDKKIMSLDLAIDNFSTCIKDVVYKIVEEYQNFIEVNKVNKTEISDFDKKFYQFLCHQENFHRIQNSLESKVIELVVEKYGTSNHNSKLPEIYVYLVEQMHKVTNNCSLENRSTGYFFKLNDLQLFAEEAMEQREFDLAKKYLLLKLSRIPSNPDYWLDYAVFCLNINDYETSLEAVREALYLNSHDQMALLFYGMLMTKLNKTDIGELSLQVLLAKYPDFIEGWVCLRLVYLSVNNFEGGDVAYQKAKKLEYEKRADEKKVLKGDKKDFVCLKYPPERSYRDLSGDGKYGVASFTDGKTLTEPLSWTTWFCPPDNVHAKTAVLLNRLGFPEYGSMALSHAILSEMVAPFSIYYTAVYNYLTGRYEQAIYHLESFVKEYGKDCFIWELMGHCYYKLDNDVNAIACYEYVMESYNRQEDIHLIYLRMGYYYLKVNKFSCAKQVFTIACKYSPSPKLWKGAGIAFLRLGELEEAEISLSEANYLDNEDPETWAYLALTNASLRRLELFKNCYLEAQKRNLSNQSLLEEIECCIVSNNLECVEVWSRE